MRLPILLLSAALPLAALASSGCTPVISKRGYLPDPVAEASITIGKDTKTTIQKKLGDPSTRATFGGDSWYYISSIQKRVAFFDPHGSEAQHPGDPFQQERQGHRSAPLRTARTAMSWPSKAARRRRADAN